MQIEGELIEIFDTEQVSDRFRKREFVVEYATNPDYPQFIKFELIQDRCGVLDEFRTGQRVTVEFDLKGRRWTDREGKTRYFTSLQAWQLKALGAEGPPPPGDDSRPPEGADDLPF
ncbi:MAG: DUF3127 domain-containing protein [SAR324 cluster bacterium]|jgi:single-stranded DNA-binding protein|nr:hypothetical protein [Deltaproteobacteria bacterium]MDE0908595.1 DUF3127 domain-containing protein [SAR324 cluster bacterium]HIF68069.1 DUF3127 domain-containing protein [Candidatus Lambdaproteobacteria bacterium]MAZ74189.1 hypothetical protein [Deltaproteobacteria bacterium]MEC7417443.1 DUF3127 domain-containing protein [SAR324 cluster bacterium]|tara:strand:- start:1297 stop:1644 length:348 start_codon:yes stop_codon:yes gene_type:complete